jgi:transcriptional regulator with XRE-family HTH domain
MDSVAFGRGVRALRIRRRLTQEHLAARAGVSRSVVARIEQGRAAATTVATLERVVAALGGRVLVKLLWQSEGLDRLLDGRHAAVVEQVVRVLQAADWTVATEVSFNEYGERGSIDVFAFHATTRSLLVVEVKTVIADAQELQSTLDRKVRLAPKLARDRGWSAASVSKLLVVVDTSTSRLRLDALKATFSTAFPSRTWAVRRWLTEPDPAQALRGIWFLRSGPQATATQRVRRRRGDRSHERSS